MSFLLLPYSCHAGEQEVIFTLIYMTIQYWSFKTLQQLFPISFPVSSTILCCLKVHISYVYVCLKLCGSLSLEPTHYDNESLDV